MLVVVQRVFDSFGDFAPGDGREKKGPPQHERGAGAGRQEASQVVKPAARTDDGAAATRDPPGGGAAVGAQVERAGGVW